ncbi:hypothetical protein SNEBB_002948 [Seison nebaliae]|nr:hypothetical protein SNEBB_002948 [Seison nebaliae]
MPIISINKNELCSRLNINYDDEEFEKECFDFGLELDDVTSERQIKKLESSHLTNEELANYSDETIYKVELPANRYDLLCLEGLSRSLALFHEKIEKLPKFIEDQSSSQIRMTVSSEIKSIRPYVVCGILRNVNFTESSYQRFIDLQDKLHQNLCKQRSLVAIGTHDLDTIHAPFTYGGEVPENIKFIPLKRTKEMDGLEMIDDLKNDRNLKKYVPIIEDKKYFPVIRDKNGVVLSVPPLINGEHSKISLKTKNVFIECTGTDLHKTNIVLNMMCSMFSEYTTPESYHYEKCQVIYSDGSEQITPEMDYREMDIELLNINKLIGSEIDKTSCQKLLHRMGYDIESSKLVLRDNIMKIIIPPTRPDVLHSVDIVEDVAIAFGYNNLQPEMPLVPTTAKQTLLNKLTESLRIEMGMNSFTEIITFTLLSMNDITSKLNLKKENSEKKFHTLNEYEKAVILKNPKTIDFEVVRTTLLSGLLKTISSNKHHSIPMNLFEISDIVFIDGKSETGGRNRRHLAAINIDNVSNFTMIHGLLGRLMEMLNLKKYQLKLIDHPTYLQDRCCGVYLEGKEFVGEFGIIHPTVVHSFELKNVVTYLELNVERLIKKSFA